MIQTWIVRIEGEHADHLTTTKAQLSGFTGKLCMVTDCLKFTY